MHIGKYEYLRVNKERPCPICERDSWCAIAVNKEFVLCARIAKGSVKGYSFGFLHRLDTAKPIAMPRPEPKRDPVDFANIIREWDRTAYALSVLADKLGVTVHSLDRLGVGAVHRHTGSAWGFPMRDAQHKIIGIKFRNLDGRKWCAKGSKLGLYIPQGFRYGERIYIAEGESDTAALLSAGFNALGRPSVNSGTQYLTQFLCNRPVTIFADRDKSGIGLTEARKLKHLLGDHVKIAYSELYKDAREWYLSGALTQLALDTLAETSSDGKTID